MSFAEVVRHELVERAPGKACCRSAFLSGLIRGAGALQVRGAGEIAVVAEIASPAAARMAFQLLRERGADCDIVTYRERRFDRRNLVQLRIHGDRSLQLLHEIGLLTSALVPTQDIPQRVLSRACCRGAYLRGAFVAAGSVSAPAGRRIWRSACPTSSTPPRCARSPRGRPGASGGAPPRPRHRLREAAGDGARPAGLDGRAGCGAVLRRGGGGLAHPGAGESADQLRPGEPGARLGRRPSPARGDRRTRPDAAVGCLAAGGRAAAAIPVGLAQRAGGARLARR